MDRTILIVEDSLAARRPLAQLLRTEGYKVLAATNAHEAMGSARKFDPDLLLLDVMIAPIDGLTFLSLLRGDPVGHELPVILVTGLEDEQTVLRAKELGVKEYLVKAKFTPEELLEAVKRHIRKPTPAERPG